MPSRFIHSFFLVCAALVLSSCAPAADTVVEDAVREVEMEGQVFIVSSDGDSIPLSLVMVQVFSREEITRFLEDREAEIAGQKELMEREIAELEREVAEARNRLEERSEAVGELLVEIERERNASVDESERRIEGYLSQIESNEGLIHELTQVPRAPTGVPSREEIEAFRERRDRWYSMRASEREAWREILSEQNEELAGVVEEIRREQERRIASWREDEDALKASLDEHDADVARAEQALRDLADRRERFPSLNEFFSGLPDPDFRVRTDGNGEFSISVPEDRRVALVARVNREVRNNTESHAWLVWFDPSRQQRQKMLLSNHNSLTLEEDASELFHGTRL